MAKEDGKQELEVVDHGRPGPVAFGPMAPAMTTKAATMASAFAGLMPSSIGEAFVLAGYLAKSSVVPYSLKGKPESCLAIIMAGMEIGLTPMKAVNNITIISGNMAMKTDLQLALVRASGLLIYHDEGFETMGTTDGDLADRTRDGAKILKLVKALPKGKVYGWCTIIRGGGQDQELKSKVFTWEDANRVKVPKKRKDQDEGEHEEETGDRTLAEQHNYRNWPQSMYPRRARGALLQVEFGDVLAGIVSVEQLEGGQVIDADFTRDGTTEDGDQLLAVIRDADSELATGIEAGFEHLKLGRAKQLQLLVQFKGDPAGLKEHLRLEAAKRMGATEILPGKKAQAAHPVEQPKPAEETKPVETKQPEPEPKAEPPKPEPKEAAVIDTKIASATARMRRATSF